MMIQLAAGKLSALCEGALASPGMASLPAYDDRVRAIERLLRATSLVPANSKVTLEAHEVDILLRYT